MKKIPLYSKIIDELKERIRTGDFEYDVPFVTEEKITKEYEKSVNPGISAITIHPDLYSRMDILKKTI